MIIIETTLAYHDRQIAEMAGIITDQWKQIEALKARLSRLGDKIEQMDGDREQGGSSSNSIDIARDEKPPHY